MKKFLIFLKWLLIIAGIIVALTIIIAVVSYVRAPRPDPVMKTVSDSASLPGLTLNGYTFHLETFGDTANPAVIALHGGPGNDYRYLLPLKPLADSFFMVFYDQRSAGLSARVEPESLSLDLYYQDLKAIIEHFSPDRPARLVGHSWGGMLAAAFISRYPEMVSHAVLAEPGFLTLDFARELMHKTNNFAPPMTFGTMLEMWKIGFQAMKVETPDRFGKMDFFFEKMAFSDLPTNPMKKYYCGQTMQTSAFDSWRFGVSAMIGISGKFATALKGGEAEVDFLDGIEDFTNEVLFIASECNTLIGANVQTRQAELFPNARVVTIKDAGHTMLGEKPQQSMRIIRDYFNQAVHADTLTRLDSPPQRQ
ncbi:MAG: alpha/beta fold hydrolase [Chitinivibrionales bacterium]|nr:alpha/beta fold hydrolase [Chitinivibrionales bacterium]